MAVRGYALRAAELGGAAAGPVTSVALLIAGCALLGVAAAGGGGAVVAIVLAGGGIAADLLTHKTRLWVHATSLGGVESTFERRRRWKTEPATIPDGLVRMSVGIEDVDDLWDDLATALDDLVTPAG